MTRAREATRRRSSGTRRPSKSAPGGPRLGEALVAVLRPEFVFPAIILATGVALPWVLPVHVVARDLIESVIEWLGLGSIALSAALVFIAVAAYEKFLPASFAFWRRFAGALILTTCTLAILSFFTPGWAVGDVDFADVSAGGKLGQELFGGPLQILGWLLLIVTGVTFIAPGAMAALAASSPALWRFIVWLRLPERSWKGSISTMRGIRWLFRSSSDEAFQEAEASLTHPFGHPRESAPVTAESGSGGFQRIAELRADGATQMSFPFDSAHPIGALTLPERPETIASTDSPVAAATPIPTQTATGWPLPSIDVLKPAGAREGATVDNARRAQLIEQTLASFGVDAHVVEISEGPTVTQFGVEPGWEIKTRTVPERDKDGRPVPGKDGRPKVRVEEVSRTRVRVNQITSLANDLALALAAPSLRIEAPVPGKPIVGIEVPNHDASVVTLRSVLESPQFSRLSTRSRLAVALGQGVSGEPVAADLGKMPHLLIAGATGSGKSVCLNAIIASILMRSSPEEVRFVMIDPKRVELTPYAQTPHLAFSRIIVDVEEVPGALAAVISEMEARYRKFAHLAVRNIEAYNKHPKVVEKLPYWVIVIDELADLMMAASYEVEKQICRLAQLARATGIHLIVATQRPSVDVITGLIKANFPTRIAFAVSSQVDSRTILDSVGAEKLLGRGDMLYMSTDAAQPRRLQGVYVSDQEIESVVRFWAENNVNQQPEKYDHLLEEALEQQEQNEEESKRDAMFQKARDLALEHTRISTSMLQRRLRIGYPRAARLMDELEEEGIVGPSEGGASREVLVSAGALDHDPAWE